MADLTFLEVDSESIHDSIIVALEQELSEPLYPGDERRIFGDALASVLVAAFNKMNDACKAKMLQYAYGEILDALGERYSCARIMPAPAKTIFRFTLNQTIQTNVIIEKGTRITPDNEVYFQTTENAVIEAGTLFVEAEGECVTSGSKYNGYLPGSINQLVDLVPYVDTVENMVATYDGDDGEPYPEEDGGNGDDHYRARIKLAPTSLSVAGPRDAYEFYAISADAKIADVAILSETQTLTKTVQVNNARAVIGGYGYKKDSLVITGYVQDVDYSVEYVDEVLTITLINQTLKAKSEITVKIDRDMAGRVLIVPILEGGEIPTEEIIQKVLDVCSADDVRPMTDMVIVQAPEQVNYDISLKYYTTSENESDCISTIEESGGSIDKYIQWQDTKMGRNINPDKLRALCLSPQSGTGCSRIVITEPQNIELKSTQVAKFSGNLTVQHIVSEDE